MNRSVTFGRGHFASVLFTGVARFCAVAVAFVAVVFVAVFEIFLAAAFFGEAAPRRGCRD